jgi:hypothetical protein
MEGSVLVLIEIFFWHLPGETEEIHGKCISE